MLDFLQKEDDSRISNKTKNKVVVKVGMVGDAAVG
jgi:hypothetical protein